MSGSTLTQIAASGTVAPTGTDLVYLVHNGSAAATTAQQIANLGTGAAGVTNVATSGAGIAGGPITATGTLTVEWNAGTINAVGSGLSTTGNTLTATGTGTVTKVSTSGLVTGGDITGAGTISLASQASNTFIGNVAGSAAVPTAVPIGGGLTINTGTLTSPSGTVTKVSTSGLVTGGDITAAGTISLASQAASTLIGNGTTAAAVPTAITLGTGLALASGALSATVPRSFIAGLVLSNDGVAPNSVIDIAAGMAADGTNASLISIGAFTKSTAGAWAAGTGSNGMGNGLTIGAGTWYHVILTTVTAGGAADIYFDTSATGANAPAGTTFARRIGSFKTNGSSNIIAFTQDGDFVYWGAAVADLSASAPGVNPGTLVTMSSPLGVKCRPVFRWITANTAQFFIAQSPDLPAVTPSNASSPGNDAVGNTGIPQHNGQHYTNTSSQLRFISSSTGTVTVWTIGYIDDRGRFA